MVHGIAIIIHHTYNGNAAGKLRARLTGKAAAPAQCSATHDLEQVVHLIINVFGSGDCLSDFLAQQLAVPLS